MKKVSVVIPCRNEEKHIKNCVLSILESSYPSIEIIVVDGMSTDKTREILKQLKQDHDNIKVVDNPQQLTPFAFNAGVLAAEGEYIQIVGSRNILDKDYISYLVKAIESDPAIGCVGGDYNHTYDTDTGKFISMAMESKFGVGASNYRTKSQACFVDTVGIPLYHRSIFESVGLFDEELTRNQDDDFNFRLTQQGYKIYFEPLAKTQYFVRGSYKKLFRQMQQYGYFKVLVNKKHRQITTLRQLVPLFFVLFLLAAPILSLLSPILFLGCLFVFDFYLISALVAAFAKTKKVPAVVFVAMAFFVMHVGYGLGYLQGIWNFLILGKKPQSAMQRQTT